MSYMSQKESKMMRRRLAGAYLSSVISISLVLFLVGIACLVIINARSVSDYFKENMKVSVLLKQEVPEEYAFTFRDSIAAVPYVNSARVVTRAEGTEELKAMLGEDFMSVFEASPVPVSVEVTLKAEYVSADSLAVVTSLLGKPSAVDEVDCQQSLVEALNSNLARISAVLAVFVALMLFISFVLINNTVRLNVFARRFTIHTMKLVGATKGFIRKPFLWRAVLQGLVSAAVAIAALCGVLFALKKSFAGLFEIFSARLVALSMAAVIAGGVLICFVSTYFVVGKLISSSKDSLYY